MRAAGSTGRWGSSTSRAGVLRMAVEGSRRDSGILAATYTQPRNEQEIVSLGDDCCFTVTVGAANRFLIRGFSWYTDDTNPTYRRHKEPVRRGTKARRAPREPSSSGWSTQATEQAE